MTNLNNILATMDEEQAHAALDGFAARFGWAYALFTRPIAEGNLHANLPAAAADDAPCTRVVRTLTDREWDRVCATREWSEHLPQAAYDAMDDQLRVQHAIAVAGLECLNCGTALHDLPTVTGYLCDHCRVDIDRQPVVDPVTAGLYWLDGGVLIYAAPLLTFPEARVGDPQPFPWNNPDPAATRRAHQARQALESRAAAVAGQPASV